MKKQANTVSAAVDNTRVLKRTKNVIKLVVTGVKINGEPQKVKFAARNERGGFVVCRAKGVTPFRIRCERDAKGREVFYAGTRGRGTDAYSAKTPQKAFAIGVQQFWA